MEMKFRFLNNKTSQQNKSSFKILLLKILKKYVVQQHISDWINYHVHIYINQSQKWLLFHFFTTCKGM